MHIKTEGVKLSIGNNDILKGIDINVENKEFVGIIGPNGSGKSTLLKCIYRNLKPSSGVIMLGDEDLSTIPIKESAKKLAVLSQHNYYDFDFKVYDIVLMGRSPHKKIWEDHLIKR
ncbi:ABC transporter ATP-binding protein [Romboutsia hominis]|uniref:ABC transporter ATP-binding protein n=1 Tax=Romboutsia hominis TaxID=1507512 RepID=UPI000B20C947|nr:ABC transporter ATP-binding protein [Romboutsia hominis]